MTSLRSRVGPLLLASSSTFALCIWFFHTLDPAGQANFIRARALFANASSPLPPESQADVTSPVEDAELQLLQESNTWGYNGKCAYVDYHRHPFSHILRKLECEFSRIAFTVLANHCTMMLAIIINLLWHIGYCCLRDLLNPFLREMSLQVIIFNIFHNPHLPPLLTKSPFSFTCLIVIIEHVAFWAFWFLDCAIHKQENNENNAYNEDEPLMDKPREENNELSALRIVNKYQQMSLSFMHIFLVFVVQLVLGMFYVYALNNNEKGWSNTSGLRWFIGMLLCNITDKDQAGYAFYLPFWRKLIWNKGDMKSYRCQAFLRMIMSFIVNLVIRTIILFTAPILLSKDGEPLDFIRDSLAVFFITKLDDLDQPISFLMDLKRRTRPDDHSKQRFWPWLLWFFLLKPSKDSSATTDETDARYPEKAMEARINALEQQLANKTDARSAEEAMEDRINALEQQLQQQLQHLQQQQLQLQQQLQHQSQGSCLLTRNIRAIPVSISSGTC